MCFGIFVAFKLSEFLLTAGYMHACMHTSRTQSQTALALEKTQQSESIIKRTGSCMVWPLCPIEASRRSRKNQEGTSADGLGSYSNCVTKDL